MVRASVSLNVPLSHTDARFARDHMARHIVRSPTISPDQLPHPQSLPQQEFQAETKRHTLRAAFSLDSNLAPVTPIHPERFYQLIRGAPNDRRLYLGFKYGFKIPHFPSPWSHPIRNHQSATRNPRFMDQYINSELRAGRILGPFVSLPPHCIISPLGLVPKKEAGSFRVIHDLSFPKGQGVNDLIPNHLTSVSYEDFDHVAHLIRQSGVGALISKVDIQNAFRIMPIHSSCVHLFGFFWRDKYYLDKCLPMGCSISCALFEQFSSALQFALISKFSFTSVSHILDDFIFISLAGSHLCQQQLDNFLTLSSFAGIPIKTSKTIQPSTSVPIHGILVDTISMEARLPADKLGRLLDLVSSFSCKKTARLRLCQSLLGHLSFACRVISPGCPFLRCLFNLLKGRLNPNHFIRLPQHVRTDCGVWKLFLAHFNGVSILSPLAPLDSLRLQFFSDASDWGCAAIFGPRWFQLVWHDHWRIKHINVREFVPIYLALDSWGTLLRHSHLTFRCDNSAVVDVINSGTTRDPDMLVIVRAITLLALRLDVHLCAMHYPGRFNRVADRLSRSQADPEFLRSAGLYEMPTPLRSSTLISMQLQDSCAVRR